MSDVNDVVENVVDPLLNLIDGLHFTTSTCETCSFRKRERCYRFPPNIEVNSNHRSTREFLSVGYPTIAIAVDSLTNNTGTSQYMYSYACGEYEQEKPNTE